MSEDVNLVARYLGIDPDTLPPLKSVKSERRDERPRINGAAQDSDLSDEEFELLRAFFPPELASENALSTVVVLNALLWSRRFARKLTQLPGRYGGFETVRKRGERWAVAGVWDRLLRELDSLRLEDSRRAELRSLCVVQVKRGERIRRRRCAGAF